MTVIRTEKKEPTIPGDNAYALAYFIVGCLASQHILCLDPTDPDKMDSMIDASHIIARCLADNPIEPNDEGWVTLPFPKPPYGL